MINQEQIASAIISGFLVTIYSEDVALLKFLRNKELRLKEKVEMIERDYKTEDHCRELAADDTIEELENFWKSINIETIKHANKIGQVSGRIILQNDYYGAKRLQTMPKELLKACKQTEMCYWLKRQELLG